jgi:hypothetical protein
MMTNGAHTASNYDRIIVDAALLDEIPRQLQKKFHIVMVRLQLDLKSLEAAKIRDGVIF